MFNYHKILKVIDLNSRILNYAGLEVLREIKTKGIKYNKTIILHRSLMQKYSNKVNKVSSVLYSIKLHSNALVGEGFCFCFKSATRLLLKAHTLLDTASARLIEMSSSIDRAALLRSLGITAAGAKLADASCVYIISSNHTNVPTTSKCFVQSS